VKTITLSSKGQLVIPKGVRNDAHLKAGARLQVLYLDGEIRLRPLPDLSMSSLDAVAGCLFKPARHPLTELQTQTAIRARFKTRNAHWVADNAGNGQLTLLAYEYEPYSRKLLLLGSHENFYRDLKKG